MQASKWIKLALLLDPVEMSALFETLSPFNIYLTSCVTAKGEGKLSHQHFLKIYSEYIEELKAGHIPNDQKFAPYFSAVLSDSEEHLYAISAGEDRQLLRVCKPVIQMQTHRLSHSTADGKFYSMTYGTEQISWGIQFSYPQLYENPETHQPEKVDDRFGNSQLFKRLQKWSRENTIPTPFLLEGKQYNLPARLGKLCLPWINCHPQLKMKQICVKNSAKGSI